MPDPYAEHARDEATLRAALWGSAGALWLLRRIPPRLQGRSVARAIRQRQAGLITGSEWWRKIWEAAEDRAAAALARISRRSSIRAFRSISAELGAKIQAESARRVAAEYVAREMERLSQLTADALDSALIHLPSDLAPAELRRALGERLGPTPKQLDGKHGIHRWEAREIEAGIMTRRQIAEEVKRRAKRASRQRAAGFASDSMVRRDSEARITVYRPAGIRVYSWNPDDLVSRPQHVIQLKVTRANPTLAGDPWAPGAPYSGSPPYGPL